MIILAFGLINWWATTLVVKSEFFRPFREGILNAYANSERKWTILFWDKMAYMVNCHMCTGTWVGLLLAAFAPPLFGSGWIPFILLALLIKAIGHLILTVWHLLESLTAERKARAEAETRKLVRG